MRSREGAEEARPNVLGFSVDLSGVIGSGSQPRTGECPEQLELTRLRKTRWGVLRDIPLGFGRQIQAQENTAELSLLEDCPRNTGGSFLACAYGIGNQPTAWGSSDSS